jgi:hypothetical protein
MEFLLLSADRSRTMRVYFLLLATVAAGLNSGLRAQGIPTIEWQACYGGSGFDIARDIKQTSDGGYIMLAQTTSPDGQVTGYQGEFDFWVVRTNASGTLLWQRALGGSGTEFPTSIIQTQDGGFVVIGSIYSIDGDVLSAIGTGRAWVIKFDPDGELLWHRLYGSTNTSGLWSLVETPTGELVLAGQTLPTNAPTSCSEGGTNAWILKLTSTGDLIWHRCYGGSSYDEFFDITSTTDNGYVAIGNTASNDGDVSGHNGSGDAWVVKVDAQGQIEWQRTLGGSSIDEAYAIKTTPDGGYAVVGRTLSSDGDVTGYHGQDDVWVFKLDANGELLWQRATGGSGIDIARDLVTHADGGITVAGWTNSSNGDVVGSTNGGTDAWLVRSNAEGALIWQQTFGGSGSELFTSIYRTSDNGFVLAGRTESNDGDVTCDPIGNNVWVAKLSAEPVGVPEHRSDPVRSLHPNPVQDLLTIELLLQNAAVMSYTWMDVTGRILAEDRSAQLPQGVQQITLGTAELPSGPLLLQLRLGEQILLLRVVKI